MRPFISASTSSARVGLGRPLRLALGAARGRPVTAINRRATGWLGIRIATVERPAGTMDGTAAVFFITSVSGPGQNAVMAASAAGGISATSASRSRLPAI